MNIVALERNSAGTDVSVDCWNELGNVTCYRNTVTEEEVRERIKDADVIIANKSPLREETLKDAPNVMKEVIKTTAISMIRGENYPSIQKLTLIDLILGTCLKEFI